MSITCESELFEKLSEDPDQIYLESDICISETFETIGEFSGMLDGQDHTIYNLGSCLIDEISEDGMVKNIVFEKVEGSNKEGVFSENEGKIQSISIKDTSETERDADKLNFIRIAKENSGCIEDCHMSGFCVNLKGRLGGICDINSGTIEDCTVTDVWMSGNHNFGGICSKNNDGIIRDCHVKDSVLIGENSVGGIVGLSKNGELSECSVTDSEVECEFSNPSGILGRSTAPTSVCDCSVENTTISGYNSVSLFSDYTSGPLESCFAQGCSINSQTDFGINLFAGTVDGCFITDTVLNTGFSFSSVNDITNSYVEITSMSDISVDMVDNFNSLYLDIQNDIADTDSTKTVEISSVEEFDKIEQFDTVELCADIDFSTGEFNSIDCFEGVFRGNGHTLSNLSNPLFKQFNGTIKNIYIDEFCVTKYSRAGCITKYSSGSVFRDITVKKSVENILENDIYGLGYALRNSSIENISISIQGEADNICGISRNAIDSLVRNCEVDLDVCVSEKVFGLVEDATNSTFRSSKSRGEVQLFGRERSNSFCGICGDESEKIIHCSSDIDITNRGDLYNLSSVSGICRGGLEIRDCTFTGNINFEGLDFMFRIGGISDYASSGTEIVSCVNKGNIKYNGEKPVGIGGIVGETDSIIRGCRNEGTIQGGRSAGGIAGELKRDGEIRNSANKGNVINADHCGGLVGLIEGTSAKIQNCYNYSERIDSEDVLIGCMEEANEFTSLFYIPMDDTQHSDYGKETQEDPEILNVILF